jgi:signal transduction histidine kinase
VEKSDIDMIISVSDTGMGIPEDALDSIFEEFRQVEGSDREHKGTGLGLPITKGFAELLGGSIGVESQVGKGSTFTVRVPMVYQAD